MSKLEECVRSVQLDGLLWGASKLVPVGYGIKKLQINCVVEDDKVGTDLLEEEITKFEDFVSNGCWEGHAHTSSFTVSLSLIFFKLFSSFRRSRVWMWLPSIRSKKPTAPPGLLLLQICTNKMSRFEQNNKKKQSAFFTS